MTTSIHESREEFEKIKTLLEQSLSVSEVSKIMYLSKAQVYKIVRRHRGSMFGLRCDFKRKPNDDGLHCSH